jgi:hypothetical protein
MRIKLTASIVACAAVLGGAASAPGAPITVALYSFTAQDDVNAFQKVAGAKCKKKWAKNQALGIIVGPGTTSCGFRTSVVADSSDTAPDQGLTATASVSGGSAKIQQKSFAGVAVRQSDEASYELRVLPVAHKWQVFRDPKGSAGPSLMGSGKGKFIKTGAKPNSLLIRAFDFGSKNTQLLATVNGRTVVSTTDSAADQPDGRRTAVTTGVKGTGAGTGVSGIFDQVSVQVPNPF